MDNQQRASGANGPDRSDDSKNASGGSLQYVEEPLAYGMMAKVGDEVRTVEYFLGDLMVARIREIKTFSLSFYPTPKQLIHRWAYIHSLRDMEHLMQYNSLESAIEYFKRWINTDENFKTLGEVRSSSSNVKSSKLKI